MAEAGRHRLRRLPCCADQQSCLSGVPLSHCRPLATHASAAQPEGWVDVGEDRVHRQRLAPEAAHPSPLAAAAFCRQTPKVGAGCPNGARPDLCGGRSAMSVPTAIQTSYEDRCVKLVLFRAGRHRPSPCVLASMGAEVELRAARGALANLVSGGTASAPRSLIRVGGAPRRATPLYVIGAARQPTSRHGRRSLGPTRPVPPGGSGPICPFHSPVSRRPVSLPPCRSRHRSVRPASAPSLAAWYRPGGIARARSGAFAPGQRP